MKKLVAVLAPLAILVACACSSTVTTANSTAAPSGSPVNHSPSGGVATSETPPASPSSKVSGRSYGVLVDLASPTTYYTVSVVGLDGRPWAQLRYDRRTPIAGTSGHAVQLPVVSASSTALYMLNGDSAVEELFLSDGHQITVARLPVLPGQETAFAVSPDDSQMAYAVLDFNRKPVHVALYTQTFNIQSPARKIFESDTDYVWPVAWHGGLLVLAHAYGPYEESISKVAPARDNPYSAVSYHVVDPSNANRVVLMGACTVSGPLSPVGSACIQGGTIDWNGATSPPWSTHDWGSISSAASLSPDGSLVAAAEPGNPLWLGIWRPDGTIALQMDTPDPHDWVGWIDRDHILIGSETHSGWQTRIVNVKDGSAVDVAAGGFYATHLPTDIT